MPSVIDLRLLVTRAALIVAATACLPAPARGGSASPPPITVQGCTMSQNPSPPTLLGNSAQPPMASELKIVYTNERDVAATEVDIRVRYNGQTLKLVDRGSFEPHAKISRSVRKFNVTFAGSSADCSVSAAAFADGSHWDESGNPPSPSASPSP